MVSQCQATQQSWLGFVQDSAILPSSSGQSEAKTLTETETESLHVHQRCSPTSSELSLAAAGTKHAPSTRHAPSAVTMLLAILLVTLGAFFCPCGCRPPLAIWFACQVDTETQLPFTCVPIPLTLHFYNISSPKRLPGRQELNLRTCRFFSLVGLVVGVNDMVVVDMLWAQGKHSGAQQQQESPHHGKDFTNRRLS